METIFTLPLSVVAAVQVLLAVLMLMPRAVSLPICTQLSKLRSNTGVVSVFYTICILLAGLVASSGAEVVRGADSVRRGDVRVDVMATVDYVRAQVSLVLCLLNLMLCLLLPKLAAATHKVESSNKNLEAMKRQVKGLQTEYERVTKSSSGDETPGSSEAAALKSKVDRLIREKNEQQDAIDAANKSKTASEAKVEALLSQIKGFDKEYDRVLEENKQLQRKLAQLDVTGGYRDVNKKDD